MASKMFSGKTCVYCREAEAAGSGDHVIARGFFFEEGRADLPKQPACLACNNRKSGYESEVLAVLPIASLHPEWQRYNALHLKPRLRKNRRVARSLEQAEKLLFATPEGPRHLLTINATKLRELTGMIALGLHAEHFGAPVAPGWRADPTQFHPAHEDDVFGPLAPLVLPAAAVVSNNIGGGTFV